ALNVLKQIGEALEHIHGEHLVHRDIKPENIILRADGTAKLADMGLAVDKEIHTRRRITKAGVAMGTPFYLSPEQVQGEDAIDIRSDLYSLGATVYEMVTGKPPFEGETAAVVMLRHLHEQVPSPHDIDRQISIGFCHIIEKLMAKTPDDRYQTPTELVEDVKAVQAGKPPLSERVPEGRSSVRRPAGLTSGRSGQSGFNRPVESRKEGAVQGSATPPFAMRAAESPRRQSGYVSSGRRAGGRISLSLLILLIVLGATAAISMAALILVIFARTTF
ncbi:MAG: serine/threonine protein kinase, partial [Planctomycetota bacterium]|nr:serine/threonine protein kinase [Planctomycetota bacterium]